jgi:peptide-methionine (R)-S-oxide reductase
MNRRSFISSAVALGAFTALARIPGHALFQEANGSNRSTGGSNGSMEAHGAGAKAEEIKKIIKSDAEWKNLLTPEQYNVLRQKGTEAPYSSPLNDIHDKGTFVCAACELPLFSSAQKFDSGTGWPSFWAPFKKGNVREEVDRSLSEVRTEVLCARCDGHLGHVFEDGPKPTGLRYCMNGVALKFVKKA